MASNFCYLLYYFKFVKQNGKDFVTFTEHIQHEKLPTGSGRKKVIRSNRFQHMQFVREYISHRESSGNIGFVPTYWETEGAVCPEKVKGSEINIDDDLSLLSSDVLDVVSSEVPANNKTSTQ
jgi:hypothetical protein